MKPKISVIIPIYNAEKYLEKNIASVYNQNFDKDKFEIILVNDGSTDNSEIIIKEAKKKYQNLFAINQNNQGVTKARAKGVEKANGKFIVFVDSDDILKPDALKILYNEIIDQKADIAMAGLEIKSKKEVFLKIYKNEVIDNKTYLSRLLKRQLHWGPFARIYKKDVFNMQTFDIPKELKTGEDAIMNKNLALKAQRIAINNKIIYEYHLHPNATMANYLKRRTEERYALFVNLMQEHLPADFTKDFLHFNIYTWIFYCKHGVILDKYRYLKQNLYRQIDKEKPDYLSKKDKFLLWFFKKQYRVNLYFFISVLYRNLKK